MENHVFFLCPNWTSVRHIICLERLCLWSSYCHCHPPLPSYLLDAHFRCEKVNSLTLYPWIHQFSNNKRSSDQTRSVSVPDIDPQSLPITSDFSMVAGDFCEVYTEPGEKWRAIWSNPTHTLCNVPLKKTLSVLERCVYLCIKSLGFWHSFYFPLRFLGLCCNLLFYRHGSQCVGLFGDHLEGSQAWRGLDQLRWVPPWEATGV